MKKLLIFIGSLERGGTEIHLLRTLPKLDHNKFNTTIFTITHTGTLAAQFEKEGINVIKPWLQRSQKWPRLTALPQLMLIVIQIIVYLIRNRPDITHFFLPLSYLIAGPLSILTHIPLRIMSRRSLNNYQQNVPKWISKCEQKLHAHMHIICGNAHMIKEQLIDEGVPSQKIQVIYNGIAPQKITLNKQAIRAKFNLPSDATLLVITANLIPYKGHKDIIKACSLLSTKTPWNLVVIGRDEQNTQAQLERYAQTLNIRQYISFLGEQQEAQTIQHACDIAILASHQEGFSNSILESMSAYLPVIATDVGGNKEAVVHDKTGYIVPPKHPKEMAKAIQTLLNNPKLRIEMGKAGRERVTKHFSLQKCAQQYTKLYHDLIDKAPKEH